MVGHGSNLVLNKTSNDYLPFMDDLITVTVVGFSSNIPKSVRVAKDATFKDLAIAFLGPDKANSIRFFSQSLDFSPKYYPMNELLIKHSIKNNSSLYWTNISTGEKNILLQRA